jgi:hypothetical protein
VATAQPRYSEEEFEEWGEQIYAQDVLPRLSPGDSGKFVAIDIESGAYEIDPDDYMATERLLLQYPEAQIWLVRVGQPTAYRIGGRPGFDPV